MNINRETKTVTFTPQEVEVEEAMRLILAEGYTVTESAQHALAVLPTPSPAYVQWLSHGTLALVDGIITSLPGRPQ